MVEVLWLPFLAGLILTGIHVYLGLHILARGVIFVDLALAQVAALGITVAFLAGHAIQSTAAYWYALAFTVAGAALFSLRRVSPPTLPHEAIIGIVYAVSAALAVLVVDRAPQGGEHIRQLLVGSILTVTKSQVAGLAALYGAIGALHVLIRRPLLEISFDPGRAIAHGRRVRAWDFCFYVTFGVVVTSSVRVAGVLLVFAYLIVPAAAAALLTGSVSGRLLIGWGLGFAVSVLGLCASYEWDLPTGAAVVATFGALMALLATGFGARRLIAGLRRQGWSALAAPGATIALLASLAGLLLLAFPRMDHPWIDWTEAAIPGLQLVFLTPGERRTWHDARQGIARGRAEIERLRAIQQDVQWGTREMPAETQERLRQFLASRGEIAAGDRMVLDTLRTRARVRQRWWLGAPWFVAGAGVGWWLLRVARESRASGILSATRATPC